MVLLDDPSVHHEIDGIENKRIVQQWFWPAETIDNKVVPKLCKEVGTRVKLAVACANPSTTSDHLVLEFW